MAAKIGLVTLAGFESESFPLLGLTSPDKKKVMVKFELFDSNYN